jgi:hypothetical protein
MLRNDYFPYKQMRSSSRRYLPAVRLAGSRDVKESIKHDWAQFGP